MERQVAVESNRTTTEQAGGRASGATDAGWQDGWASWWQGFWNGAEGDDDAFQSAGAATMPADD